MGGGFLWLFTSPLCRIFPIFSDLFDLCVGRVGMWWLFPRSICRMFPIFFMWDFSDLCIVRGRGRDFSSDLSVEFFRYFLCRRVSSIYVLENNWSTVVSNLSGGGETAPVYILN